LAEMLCKQSRNSERFSTDNSHLAGELTLTTTVFL
jgi:hypothetical protein